MSEPEGVTKWQPNADQERLLSVFQDADYKITICDACDEAQITRRQYYRWHDIPEFSAWWEEQANRFFQMKIALVHAAVFASATGDAPGSPQAQKLFYERHDKSYCPKTRQDQNITGKINLGDLDQAELEKLAHATDDDDIPAGPVLPDAPDAAD